MRREYIMGCRALISTSKVVSRRVQKTLDDGQVCNQFSTFLTQNTAMFRSEKFIALWSLDNILLAYFSFSFDSLRVTSVFRCPFHMCQVFGWLCSFIFHFELIRRLLDNLSLFFLSFKYNSCLHVNDHDERKPACARFGIHTAIHCNIVWSSTTCDATKYIYRTEPIRWHGEREKEKNITAQQPATSWWWWWPVCTLHTRQTWNKTSILNSFCTCNAFCAAYSSITAICCTSSLFITKPHIATIPPPPLTLSISLYLPFQMEVNVVASECKMHL